jgi:hypothetical protein
MSVAIFSEDFCTKGSLYNYDIYFKIGCNVQRNITTTLIELSELKAVFKSKLTNIVRRVPYSYFLFQNLDQLHKFMDVLSSFRFIIFHCFKS